MRGVFSDYKITILIEWSKQWSQYQHSWHSEVTDILKSIIMTELEDYRHEYLRLLMSEVFNDNKFTILNVPSKQWYHYQHSWQCQVTHIFKSRILNEWSQQWSQYPDFVRNGAITLKIL